MARQIIPISQIPQRPRQIGKIRMGEKKLSQRGTSYPAKLDKFRVTSPDRAALEQVAQMYGGTVQPWEESPGQFEVYTDASEMVVQLAGLGALRTVYSHFTKAGRDRRCDGVTCERIVDGEAVVEPCWCALQGDATREEDLCKMRLSLDVILAGVPVLGTWTLETSSWTAAQEIPAMVAMLQQSGGPFAPCAIAIEPRESRTPGQKPKQFIVPALRIRPDLAQQVRAMGGVSLAQALNAQSAALGALPTVNVVDTGVQALPSANAIEGETVIEDVQADPETGEVLNGGHPVAQAQEPAVTEPAKPSASGPTKEDVQAAMKKLGWDLSSPAIGRQLDEFKAICGEKGKGWTAVFMDVVKAGHTQVHQFVAYAKSLESAS